MVYLPTFKVAVDSHASSMVWKRWTLFECMAIFGIYVRFLGGKLYIARKKKLFAQTLLCVKGPSIQISLAYNPCMVYLPIHVVDVFWYM